MRLVQQEGKQPEICVNTMNNATSSLIIQSDYLSDSILKQDS